jgi:prepilin-type processing-associated H-X9-DG protein
MANLKSLYIAAEAYNMDQAKYPSALSELKEKGHAEGAVFRCPTDPSPAKIAEDFECSYECAFDRPGFPAGGMGVEFPAIWDKNPGHHGGVRNVAFFDGHVERVTEARFQELIKKLDEEMGKEPPKEENGEGEEGATEGEGGDEGEGATEEGKEEGKEETEEGDEEGTKEGVKKETEEGAKEE